MVTRICLLVLVTLITLSTSIKAQDGCVAGSVFTLNISPDAFLTWEVDPNEPCQVDEFQLDIVGSAGDEFHFKVRQLYADLYFLEVCEQWVFIVTPISNGVLGYERRLTEYIPMPSNSDLSLQYFRSELLGERDVLLTWNLANRTRRICSLQYLLTVEDEELGIIQDVYVQGSSLHLSFLSPCVPYQLGLRAVNTAHLIEGPQRQLTLEINPKPQVRPTLRVTDIQATTMTIAWVPEGGTNRCPVRSLHIDGNYLKVSVPLQSSLDFSPVPVQLVSLRPNSMYLMSVSVENSGGVSNTTLLGIQTLELSPS